MVGLVVFAQVLPGAVKAGLHRRDSGAEGDGDFSVAAAFLHEGEEGAVLRAELIEGMAEGIEFLGTDGTRRLGHVFVLGGERREDPAKFLPAEVIDAGVAREPEKPRLKLLRFLQACDSPDQFDKDELRDVLDRIAATDDGVDESGDAVLVGHDELALGVRIAALHAADKVDRGSRLGGFHFVFIASPSQTQSAG